MAVPTRRNLLGSLFAALFAGLFVNNRPIATPTQQLATCDFSAIATNANATTMIYSASGLPAGLALNSNTGTLSGHIGGSGGIVSV